MNIQRFFARNSREAISQVRNALGADAIILSNRAVEGGTEILAVKERDMDQMINVSQAPAAPTAATKSFSQQQIDILTRRTLLAETNIAQTEAQTNIAGPAEINFPQTPAALVSAKKVTPVARPVVNSAKPVASASTDEVSSIRNELQNMRFMLQSQLTELSWNNIQQRDPIKSNILSMMISAGFSPSLSRMMAEKSPTLANRAAAFKWLSNVLAHNMNCIPDESELLSKAGVFALIGPTGVGKTTTTAKLAARYVMKHGAKNLALITTDAYRIGGHEQLRIYGKILGVMVHSVKDQADLKLALQELKNKHTILIDTVGVSQRDTMVTQQIAMLHGADKNIKKLLCLNATSTGETLSDVTRAYKGQGIDGAIITKVVEAATIGSVLDIIIREKLKLYYVANGQRVPEDLSLANKQKLVAHALKLATRKQDIYSFQAAELPALMAATVSEGMNTGAEHYGHGVISHV